MGPSLYPHHAMHSRKPYSPPLWSHSTLHQYLCPPLRAGVCSYIAVDASLQKAGPTNIPDSVHQCGVDALLYLLHLGTLFAICLRNLMHLPSTCMLDKVERRDANLRASHASHDSQAHPAPCRQFPLTFLSRLKTQTLGFTYGPASAGLHFCHQYLALSA